LKNLIRQILLSETNDLRYRRRLRDIREIVTNTFAYIYPCDFDNFLQFMEGIKDGIMDNDVFDWVEDEETGNIAEFVEKHLRDELDEYYSESCYSRDLDLYESEEEKKDYSEFYDVIDDSLSDYYGEIKKQVSDDGYVNFVDSENKIVAHKNLWGRLWISDNRFPRRAMIYIPLESEEKGKIFIKYMEDKYNVKIKDVDYSQSSGDYDDEF
jgi:hypothetical protein